MKHLYQNHEGETVAADTLEQAARHHDCELGGMPEPEDGWSQIADGAVIPAMNEETGETNRKTAAELAAECDEPVQVFTTYV